MIIPPLTKQLIATGIPKLFVSVIHLFVFIFNVELCIERYTWYYNLQLHLHCMLSFFPSLATGIARATRVMALAMHESYNFLTNVLQPNVEKLGFEKVIWSLYNDHISYVTRIYPLYNICHVYLYSLGHAWEVVMKIHYMMILLQIYQFAMRLFWKYIYEQKTLSCCCLPHRIKYNTTLIYISLNMDG